MRLLTVGRSSTCDIVLNSDKASALHAEITVLDNGDIFVEDKNSLNGTFVGNTQITPNTEVQIRRGDYVRFANVELQWAQVPMPEDNKRYKAIYNIGSNYRNDIHIDGSTVSRYHATLKITKNGKAFIKDHSKNGTTVNGVKIRRGEDFSINRNSAVVCGGVPVDLKDYIPVPIWPKIVLAIASVAVLIGAVFFIGKIIHKDDRIPNNVADLIDATVCVHGEYYLTIVIENDPFKGNVENWPTVWYVGQNKKAYFNGRTEYELKVDINDDSDGVIPFKYRGTGFFISRDGKIGTNRHIALPWEEDLKAMKMTLEQFMATYREKAIKLGYDKKGYPILAGRDGLTQYISKKSQSVSDAKALINLFKSSPISISGRLMSLSVGYPNRKYSSESEWEPCQVLVESGNPEIDVAILQLNNRTTPPMKYIYEIELARCDARKNLQPQKEELTTIGYPARVEQKDRGELLPTLHNLRCSKIPGEYDFQFQGEGKGGASGSPIVGEDNRLVGVLYAGYTVGSTYGIACQIKYMKDLYDKTKEN